MATDVLSRPRPAGRSITAAAKRIPVRNETSRGGTPKRSASGWVDEAWSFFDDVPEVKYAARFLGSALSRLRFYPAIVLDPDQPPVALADAAAVAGSGVTAALAAAADEEMARLDGGEGRAGLQREFGICLTIAGEANLVGRDVDGEEEWRVYSESAITTSNNRVAIKETPSAAAEELADDDFVARIWRRHSRWPGLADSNMRAILSVCEELLIYERQFRAVGRSRNNAGMLLLPNELDFAQERVVVDAEHEDPDDDSSPIIVEAQDDEDDLTELERGIVESLVTPTADDGSASQVVPHILRGPAEALAAVRHIPLDRLIDGEAIARMVHLISRMANGLDIPVEVLTGLAQANHWSSWQIEDATYKAHVEPLAQIPASGIASVFLRPALLARSGDGFDPAIVKRIVLAIDPSALVVRPNRVGDAKDAFDRDALSWDALRSHLGFSDADAPSSDELLLRYTLDRSIGGVSLTRDLFNIIGYDNVPDAAEAAEDEGAGAGEGDSPGSDANGGDNGGDPTPDTDGEASIRRVLSTLQAAASSSSQIGERLAMIDARLRDRLQGAASEAITAALAKAGARLRAAVQGDPALASRVKGQPNEDVGQALGEAGAALAAAEELISAQDFAGLAARWASEVPASRAGALEAARRDAAAHGVDGEEFARLAVEELGSAEEDDADGWELLLIALLTLARSRIFTPDGSPDDGEFDPHVAVPAGVVRDALARAGGALGEAGVAPSATGAGAASGGPASGPKMLRLLARTGAVQVAWRWDVGMPAAPFPPHQSLQGLVFRSWDAEELASSGFPNRGRYFPGDHRGCQCDAVPVIVYEGTKEVVPGARDYSLVAS